MAFNLARAHGLLYLAARTPTSYLLPNGLLGVAIAVSLQAYSPTAKVRCEERRGARDEEINTADRRYALIAGKVGPGRPKQPERTAIRRLFTTASTRCDPTSNVQYVELIETGRCIRPVGGRRTRSRRESTTSGSYTVKVVVVAHQVCLLTVYIGYLARDSGRPARPSRQVICFPYTISRRRINSLVDM